MVLKRALYALITLLVLVGCTPISQDKASESYSITTIMNPEGQSIAILSFQDEEGDFYFRVLPNSTTLNQDVDYYEGYSSDWTLVKKPTFK